MLKKLTFIFIVAVMAMNAHAASNRPSGYTTICKTDQTCSVSSATNVAFGAAGSFVYKVLSGSFTCNVSTFGSDPIPSKSVKECSIPSDGSSSTSSTSSSGSGSTTSSSSSGGSSSGSCGTGGGATVCLKANPGSNDIDLEWTVSGSITSAQVYRDTDSDPSGRTRIASLSGSARSYSDASASSGTQYWYWIKFTANGAQYNSNSASATYGGGSSGGSTSSSSSGGSSGSSSECVAGATISGKTIDCGGKTLGLSCSGDSETQPPVLILKNATVKNLKISASGGSDGIHCTGNCTMENVQWLDICEDAATNKSDGVTMTIKGGSAYNSSSSGAGGKPDKVFQHNSKNSTTVVGGGFTLTGDHGKLWRSCGNCTNNGGPRNVKIDGVNINASIGAVVGVNRNYGDKATIRNLKIKNYKSGSPHVCDEYKGVEKGNGESTKYGEYWNTSNCDVSKSDVSAL